MKKIDLGKIPDFKGKRKLLLTMKLTLIFLLACFMQVSATVYSQSTKFNFDVKNKRIVDVLREIEDNSDFRFFYQREQVNVETKVDLNITDETVEEILPELFANQKITFDVRQDNLILIKPKGAETVVPDFIAQQQQQQQRAVSGTVTDESGEPLPGVTVVVKGTTKGTVTNADGEYSLTSIPEDATLQFSFVGMLTQEVVVGDQPIINIEMTVDAIGIEEIVAVGYGTKKRGELTGSVSDVEGTTLEQSPSMDLTKTLEGRLSGLIVNDRGGAPGEDNVDMLIRGHHTLGNNSPLIVIDGVPRSGFGNLSSSDIASISVLKDASAAIYGARAANGVIVVTTKRGKGETEIRLNSNFGVSTFTRMADLMESWQYAQYRNEIVQRFGMPNEYTQEDIAKFKSGDSPETHPNTDWLDEIYNDFANFSSHNLSVSGSGEKVKYYISGDYRQEDGMYSSGDKSFKQYQTRSNLDVQVTDFLQIGVDLHGRLEDDQGPPHSAGAIMQATQRTLPTEVAYFPNGLPAYSGEKGETPIKTSSYDSGFDEEINRVINSKFSFDLDMNWITQGLELNGYGVFDFNIENGKIFRKPFTLWSYNPENNEYIERVGFRQDNGELLRLEQWNSVLQEELYHLRLSYNRNFGDHKVNSFIAYEQSESTYKYLFGSRRNLYSEEKTELFAGEEEGRQVDGTSRLGGRVNYFGVLSYDYLRKYMVEFTLRRDGSFNFPKGKRFGTFPGVSVGWTVSEESFMSSTNAYLDNLKIRASWAEMGNDRVPSYQYLSMYELGDYYVFGTTPNPKYIEGMYISNTPNPNITWEVSDSKNIGFDAIFWNGKLSMNFDYFYEKRRNILIPRQASIPDYTAIELPDENLGKVDNSGVELTMNYQNAIGKLNYYLGGNFTYVKNKIVFMDEAENIPEYRKQEGHPMNSYVVYETDGIFNSQEEIDNYPHINGTQPGDIKYVDFNNDGSIDSDDRIRKYTSPIPEIQFGINTGLQYQNIELNILFQGQGNAETLLKFDDLGNRPEFLFTDRWTEENKDSRYARPFDDNDEYNRTSTYHLYNSSFIRLKNLEIAYNFASASWMSGFKGFRVYLSGFNLWTIDHIKHFDPEMGNAFQGRYYPQQTRISLGVDIRL